MKTTVAGISLVIGLLLAAGCGDGGTAASDAVRTSTSQTTPQASGGESPPAFGEATVVASGDVKGFPWDLIAYRDGDQTCYRVLHREAIAGWDCATPAAREVAEASIVYIDAVPFAVGITGHQVERVHIRYSIAYSVSGGDTEQEPGDTQEATAGWVGSEARLFIVAMPKGVRLQDATPAE